MFFSDASIPVTVAPNLAIGSLIKPPPQPISKIFIPSKKLNFSFFILNCFFMFSVMYSILTGLNMCRGLNFPLTSHHSSASFENF